MSGPLFSQLQRLAEENGERIAFRDEHQQLSYRTWMEQGARLATDLAAGGMGSGSKLLFYSDDPLQMLIGYAACFQLGAVCVPLDPHAALRRVREIAVDCRADGMLVSPSKRAVLQQHSFPWPIFCVEGEETTVHAPEGRMRRAAAASAQEEPRLHDAAFIFYTSGSTGKPKGAIIPQNSVRVFMEWGKEAFQTGPQDVFLCHAPLHFDMSLFALFVAAAGGSMCVLPATRLRTNPTYLIGLIKRNNVSVLHLVPSAVNLLLQSCSDDERLEGVKAAIFSGEPLPGKLLPGIRRLLPGARIVNVYGSTETNDALLYELPAEHPVTRPVPIGRPLPHVTALVLDPRGKPCAEGETGELFIRSETAMSGYIGVNPRETFTQVEGYAGSFFPTRDLVKVEHGLYHYVGRKDNLIKLNGQRVDLGWVERVLLNHPDVREAAVIVRQHRQRKQLVAVLSAAQPPARELSTLALRAYCAAHLSRPAIPSRYIIRAEPLPKTSTGKIDRRAIAAELAQAPDLPISKQELKQFIVTRFLPGEHAESLPDDYHLLENGVVDSLGLLGVVVYLEERLGVEIAEEEMTPDDFASVERIVSFLKRKGWW